MNFELIIIAKPIVGTNEVLHKIPIIMDEENTQVSEKFSLDIIEKIEFAVSNYISNRDVAQSRETPI